MSLDVVVRGRRVGNFDVVCKPGKNARGVFMVAFLGRHKSRADV